jgi:hypothetical protein
LTLYYSTGFILFMRGGYMGHYWISEVAEKCNINKETIRYYERKGLIVNYHFISEQKSHFFAHSFRKPSPLF